MQHLDRYSFGFVSDVAVPVKAGKRKKDEQKPVTPAKKQKTGNCGECIVTNDFVNLLSGIEQYRYAVFAPEDVRGTVKLI